MSFLEEVKKLDGLGGSGEDVMIYKGRDLKTLSEVEIMKFCKANFVYKEPGVSFLELACLHEAVKTLGDRPIVSLETGMCFGTTTRYFALRNMKYGSRHYACEIKIREPFKKDMIDLGLWSYITVLGDSMTCDFHDKLNVLYIDSEHGVDDALGEYMRYRRFLQDEAIIGFHDSSSCWGVREAIDIIKKIDGIEYLTGVDGFCAGIEFYKLKGLRLEMQKRDKEMREKETKRLEKIHNG